MDARRVHYPGLSHFFSGRDEILHIFMESFTHILRLMEQNKADSGSNIFVRPKIIVPTFGAISTVFTSWFSLPVHLNLASTSKRNLVTAIPTACVLLLLHVQT